MMAKTPMSQTNARMLAAGTKNRRLNDKPSW